MPALIVDAGVATVGAGPVLTKVVAGAGSTFTVRNTQLASGIWLLDAWRHSAHVGRIEITSPKIAPVSNGLRLQTPTGLADFLLRTPPYQLLTPQDTLEVQDDGTAADVDMIAIQSYYKELPGIDMKLKMPGDIEGQFDYELAWPVAVTSSATAGAQNETVITTTVDSSSANAWYAVIGYLTDTLIGCVGIKGIDTSASFIGGPGDTVPRFTTGYFRDLSVITGMPCIPMFNAANKASTNVCVVARTAEVAANITLILAKMKDGYQP